MSRRGRPRRPARGVRLRLVHGALQRLSPRLWFLEDEVVGLHHLVRPGAVCVDVGAEYGLYTWALAHLAGPSGAVVAVEPLPGPGRVLALGRLATGARTVRLRRAALAAAPGLSVMSLPVRRSLPVHGRAYLTEGATDAGPNAQFSGQRAVPVAVDTLDALLAAEGLDRVDVVKADVEGAELAVLRGARGVLERHRPALLLEVEARHLAKYGATPEELVAHLRGLGYRPHAWRGGRWAPVDGVSAAHRNYAFLPGRERRTPARRHSVPRPGGPAARRRCPGDLERWAVQGCDSSDSSD